MATGRLASGSIAAGGATQLYRNSTGNSQVVTLLASSQVSGKAPKLNVKITSENFTVPSTSTEVISGTNHTLTDDYPTLAAQITAGTGTWLESAVTTGGNRLHLSIDKKEIANSMGQSWSVGYNQSPSGSADHPWGKVSFGGQPTMIGGSNGGNYRFDDTNRWFGRYNQQCYDPYYFENPNAFNQNKARGIVVGNDGRPWYHLEDISKMSFEDLKKYHNAYNASATYYNHDDPGTDAAKWGTRTSIDPSYYNRGYCYDLWTGLVFSVHSNGYSAGNWFDENNPSTSLLFSHSSDSGMWKWGSAAYDGSDSQSYDTDRHGSVYGCDQDIDHGLFISSPGRYNPKINLKWFGKWFENTMDNKDTRARDTSTSLNTFTNSSYYHWHNYQGNARAFKLQWVKYNPHTDKYYVCFWDNSGDYSTSPVPTMGTSYPAEAGIFEVDVTKIYGHSQAGGASRGSNSFATEITAGLYTKKGSVPDTVSGLMSKPMRIKDSLWVSHCQNGKHYFSTNLYTWEEQDSDTHFSTDYAMVNASKKGAAGSSETDYFVAADSKSVVYSYSATVSNDVYDQAAVSGIIAKGAVTPYEQKAIILSDGDAIYVENEDATNAISITAMGVDV